MAPRRRTDPRKALNEGRGVSRNPSTEHSFTCFTNRKSSFLHLHTRYLKLCLAFLWFGTELLWWMFMSLEEDENDIRALNAGYCKAPKFNSGINSSLNWNLWHQRGGGKMKWNAIWIPNTRFLETLNSLLTTVWPHSPAQRSKTVTQQIMSTAMTNYPD